MTAQSFASAQSIAETRINIIVTQINYIVRESTGSTSIKQVLKKGMIDNQWIAMVRVWAYDNQDRIWAQIEVKVDWERHKINLARHGKEVLIDKNLPEEKQVSWVIGEITEWFKNYSQKSQLQTGWTIGYVPEIENNPEKHKETTHNLGLVYGPSRRWVDGAEIQEVLSERPAILDETTISLRVAS
jgi:hypothetical protein